jgi:hypothetical protein
MMQSFKVQFRDMAHVTNLNLHTQEFPFDAKQVKEYFMSHNCNPYLCKVGARHVGFALATFDKFTDAVTLDLIGSRSAFRRVHVGTNLVERICVEGHTEGFKLLRMLVPSYLVDDMQDPWNIEGWLWKLNFKATKTVPGCYRYGKDYEYYHFERRIP